MDWTKIGIGCKMPRPGHRVLVTMQNYGELHVRAALYMGSGAHAWFDEDGLGTIEDGDTLTVTAWAHMPEPFQGKEA